MWRSGSEETIDADMEGSIPKDWKTSVICPIYKKGNKERAEN